MRMRLWLRLFWGESLRALARHKVRSALTALGVMVGVAAVVWVVAIGKAGTARAQAALEQLGDNLVWIEAGSRNVAGVRTGSHGTTSLLPEDADAVRNEIHLIREVAENVDGSVQIAFGNRNWSTRWRGVSPEYFAVKRWRVAEGALLSNEDVQDVDSVVLLGQTARRELFGALSPIGEVIRIGNFPFRVKGVLEAKGQSTSGQDQDDVVMLPWTTAQKKLRGKGYGWLDDILCSAVSRQAVNPAVEAVTALMRQRHHIAPGDEDDFNVRRPDEIINAQIQASRTLEILLVALASISLLVGGIGIMNVMLASVAQRTNEIGLRVAVGASPSAVHVQFLGEAVLLSLVGGVLGVLLSVGGEKFIEKLLGWSLSTPPEAALIAVAYSVGTGVLFGFYPAWRAARLDPIAALRSD
jgi:putative ABC transport system permease protein